MGRLMKSKARFLFASTAFAWVAVGSVASVFAADMAVRGGTTPAGPAPMAVGGWLFSPTLFAGGVYTSNVNQTENGRVTSWGERVTPGFSATLNNGIHQTSIYGLADFINYTASGATDKTTVDAKAGLTQVYMAQRDLTFRFNADYTRQADTLGGLAFAPVGTPLATTSGAPVAPVTVSPQVSPNRFNQYSAAGSVEKRFGRTFIVVGGNVIATKFDSNTFATSRDGTVYTLQERTGFDITPQIYAFIDPALSWQRYDDSTRNSNGYRVTGGVGTAGNGLWRGEVYGGYQAQKNNVIGTYSSGVYGLRVGYAPTRFWDLSATLDESLGGSTIAVGGLTGVATKTTTGLLNVGYKGLPQGWSLGGRFGYIRTTFVNATRTDTGWLAGANVNYEIWRNLGLTLDYQYKAVNSNVALQSFNQQMVSLGLSYKY
jgi:hypothetical protein